ncbi:MAG: NHLP leader peptide family RiPP precursor [Chloroflexi bacterium]|nr:NHLP leader peptide family RiPP precursor [Chloroflexota bacterium]MBU1751563.1 NHLP leader peptide family RiPP precursor [Chloroflexota bacterium]
MDLHELINRAWHDDAFKRELLANPKAVIERALGVVLPDEVNIHVHEQTPTEVHLVLPMPPTDGDTE